ncbi:hypothetical protein TNCV_2420191 [Trichonephila clavipes]|nr:hypothetical protein TNCV_2420191 [Trichonephila clavipes]
MEAASNALKGLSMSLYDLVIQVRAQFQIFRHPGSPVSSLQSSRFSPHLKVPSPKCQRDWKAGIEYYPFLKPASHLETWFGPLAPKRTSPLNGPCSTCIARKVVVSPVHVFEMLSPLERYPSQKPTPIGGSRGLKNKY